MLSSAAAYYYVKSRRGKVPPKKVAIIGSGCSGLGALWALQDSQHEVHLYEKEDRLGGHTNTCQWKSPISGETTPVDTGFIVMNTATYPNFQRFLQEVNVPTAPTQMTFGVSRDGGRFEWSGNAEGIFAQRSNFFRPRHWRMIFDIVRFNEFALDLLREDDAIRARDEKTKARRAKSKAATKIATDPRMYKTIGAYLHEQGYSQAFKDDYLIPMTAAVWSTSPDKASLDFPAITLVRFMWNHHLLSTIATRPLWLTIPGGSQRYIDAIVKLKTDKKFHVHGSSPVKQVVRTPAGKLQIHTENNNDEEGPEEYDHVVFACHGDEILPLLAPSQSASPLEEEILTNFQTTENKAYLHSDPSLMPRRRNVYTAWNYLTTTNPSPSKASHPAGVSLTYWMNLLQHIPDATFGQVLVTLNPPHPPAAPTVQGEYTYRHPLYTVEAVRAQERLEEIQNVRGVSYAGAWTKYGFHEDGFTSGLKVAVEHLGVQLPFELADSTYSRGRSPRLGIRDYIVRAVVSLLQLWVLAVVWVAGVRPIVWGVGAVGYVFEVLVDRLEGGSLPSARGGSLEKKQR